MPKHSNAQTASTMGAAAKFSSLVTQNPTPIPGPGGKTPDCILYYKLGLGDEYGWHFTYSNAGVAFDGAKYEKSIAIFIDQVLRGNPVIRPFIYPPKPPHILVSNLSAYIVIELDDDVNWRFLKDQLAFMVGDKPKPKHKYFDLHHIDTDGNDSGATPPAADKTCRLIYFHIDPAHVDAAAGELPIVDKFSLYFECVHNFDPSLALILDPDIKNNGGDVPPFLGE